MQAKKYDVIMVMSNESSYSLDERLMACFIGSLVGLCLGYYSFSFSILCFIVAVAGDSFAYCGL